ncbi:MAG: beta-lactamase family protein [Gemmatimonadetes bacterium]|nr:beta-lactamase family protein [Gemmatimonadota bacterium]
MSLRALRCLPSLLVFLLPGFATAQGGVAPPAVRGPRDVAEIEAFMDGLMTSYLRDKKIAGATVSVVRDTTILFAKGYGFADVGKRQPVDPDKTLFRIGSISKTFTWTAVMQLVEEGKLDLDKDVNEYLDFKIPAAYDKPITLRDILSHSPGLEEDGRGLFTSDPAEMQAMKDWLPAHMPGRVRAPGTFSSYSNWATAAAGYIVERVSGRSFDEFIEQRQFQPLGMVNASSRQPLPASLLPQMSEGYSWKDGRYAPEKFEIVTGAAPAGSFSVSARDMGTWMIAHLNHGAYRGQRILAESTSVRMQTRIQGHDPRIPGFAHGFYEQSTVGPRAIGHGGDTQYFHSSMILLPGEKVGFFVSFNTSTGGEVSFKPFADDVFNHYYPEPLPVLTPKVADAAALQRFAGEYVFNRMSYTTFQKALALSGAIKVAATDSGVLVATTPFGPMRLVPVDSLLFRDEVSHDLVAFRQDDRGRITHGFLSMAPMMAMEKLDGARAPGFHLMILGLGIVTLLGVIGAAVVRYFGRRGSGRPAPDPLITNGRRLMLLVGVLVVGFLASVAGLASDPIKYILGNEIGSLRASLTLPVLALVVTLGAAAVAAMQWARGAGTLAWRVRHSLAVVVCLAFFWSLNSWNLLGWKF